MRKMPKLTIDDEQPTQAVAGWMMALRAALFNAVKEEDVTEIAQGLVKRAKDGDLQATRLLFSYLVGGPPSIKVQNALVLNQAEPSAPADSPSCASPGSPGRISHLAARASNGQAMHHAHDARFGTED